MPTKHLLIAILLLLSVKGYTQERKLSGTVTDTSSAQKMHKAVVSLLRTKDSVLLRFIRTSESGFFEIEKIQSGKYLLLISYPGYADYADEVDLTDKDQLNISFSVLPKSKLLEEIIIQQKVAAIRIKGDTTEFKADSFRVGPNANVQDLLKRLPGLQVNSKGEITAQGQKVEKILVDGEEFFSDDPAVVTQNLRANVVDKVQVFDKKSEQAEFTGVDDGQKTKTINLELKEDKKKGYFGKLEAGTDFKEYQSLRGMINAFKKKRKLSAYVTNNNTSFEGLSWSEQRNYGSSTNANMGMTEDGGMYFMSEGDDFSRGQGLPNSTAAGINYGNKWNKDKNNLNGSYQFNDQDITGRNSSVTKTILPDTTFTNTTSEIFKSFRQRNKLSGVYDWQIDSVSSLKFKASGSIVKGRRTNTFTGESISEENTIINTTRRTTSNNTENRDFTSELNWKKRLKKAGRTLSITGNWSNNNRTGDGYLLADNSFFGKTGNLITQQNINQLKTNDEKVQNIQSRIVYTEPLSKKLFFEVNYRNAFNRNNAIQNTLEQTGTSGIYNKLVDSLSNHFLFRTTDHAGGFSFRYNEKKYSLSIGAAVGRTNFELDELRKNQQRSRSFTNLLPKASIRFNPKKQRNISLSYDGTTQNPTLQQINPIIDNIDPVNITIGNENLKQAFRHNFTVNISDYKIIKSRNFYLWANFALVNNAITNANTIDSIGRRINQSINANGNYNGTMYAQYGFEITKGVNLSVNSETNISRFVNYVNGKRNVSDNYTAGLGIGLYKWSEKILNFGLNIRPARNFSRSSINSDIVTKFWSFTANPNIELSFKKQKFFVNIEGDFTVYQRTSTFQNQRNIFLIHGNIRKTFTKTDAFELKLSVNDLLNQNLGIQRNISSNFVQENTFQNLRRFFLLTFTWNFTKNGKPSNGF